MRIAALTPVKRLATDGTMTVNVRDQASGGGSAEIDTGDVYDTVVTCLPAI